MPPYGQREIIKSKQLYGEQLKKSDSSNIDEDFSEGFSPRYVIKMVSNVTIW